MGTRRNAGWCYHPVEVCKWEQSRINWTDAWPRHSHDLSVTGAGRTCVGLLVVPPAELKKINPALLAEKTFLAHLIGCLSRLQMVAHGGAAAISGAGLLVPSPKSFQPVLPQLFVAVVLLLLLRWHAGQRSCGSSQSPYSQTGWAELNHAGGPRCKSVCKGSQALAGGARNVSVRWGAALQCCKGLPSIKCVWSHNESALLRPVSHLRWG